MTHLRRATGLLTATLLAVTLFTVTGAAPAEADIYSDGGGCSVSRPMAQKAVARQTRAKKKLRRAKKKLRRAKRRDDGVAKARKVVRKKRKKLKQARRKRRAAVALRRELCSSSLTRVSVGYRGQGNGTSWDAEISANDRFVVFASEASNLVPGDTNGVADVFVRDLVLRRTTRVSVPSGGGQATARSAHPTISADGRIVAFVSTAPNLVPGVGNGRNQAFVHDRATGRTTHVSPSIGGGASNGQSLQPSLSANGRHVVYRSSATDLVAPRVPATYQVYAFDRAAGTNRVVSTTPTGLRGNGPTVNPRISGDGRFVSYITQATNYVTGRGGAEDPMVFQWARSTGRSTIVSVDNTGAALTAPVSAPTTSADGRYVLFAQQRRTASGTVASDVLQRRDRLGTTGHHVRTVGDRYATQPWLSPDGGWAGWTAGVRGVLEEISTGIRIDLLRGNPVTAAERPREISVSTLARAATFTSTSPGLVRGDTNQVADIFVRRR